MAAQIGGREGHHYIVASLRGDGAIASRTGVRLDGLVRLEESDLELTEDARVVHADSAEEGPQHEGRGEKEPARHDHRVERPTDVLAGRIEAHGLSMAATRLGRAGERASCGAVIPLR
jgi:hypothetical protein